jgi:hypothetical protein
MFDKIRKYFGFYTINDFPKFALGNGNHKIAKGVKIFNLPAINSCPNCSLCAPKCYAKRAEKRFPKVFASRMKNFNLAKFHTKLLKKLILRDLQGGEIVRIHESGDFFNEKYINMWYEIALERTNCKFYTYTKNKDFPFERFSYLLNFNVINSILPDGTLNFGKEDVMTEKAKLFNATICPCRRGMSDKVCMLECRNCLTDKCVVFIQH